MLLRMRPVFDPRRNMSLGATASLEFLLTRDAVWIREVAVKREEDVLHLRIHGMVKAFDRVHARRHAAERVVHLRHVMEFEGGVPLRQLRRCGTVGAAREETILPRVVGKDATAVEGIWNDLWRATATYNRGGIVTMAMSALDIALWDAIGKRAGLPLHRLWGHVRAQIPVYGSDCFRGSGGDRMIAKALHYTALGYRSF